jgi:hypothetical protein
MSLTLRGLVVPPVDVAIGVTTTDGLVVYNPDPFM